MSTPPVERKLAAILSADVAGYSRLMGADEAGTLAAFSAHREVIGELIRQRNCVGDGPHCCHRRSLSCLIGIKPLRPPLQQRAASHEWEHSDQDRPETEQYDEYLEQVP
jgi:hypothetical protein